MEAANQKEIISGQQFQETVKVDSPDVPPDHGLFQVSYPLSEADYLRLRHSSSVFATLGGAAATFGFQKLVEYYTGMPGATLWQILVGIPAVLLGVLSIGGSYAFSLDRRRIMKKIRNHFTNNPTAPACRVRRY